MSSVIPPIEEAVYIPATGKALGKKGIGWAIFEFARNPYYNVIVIGIFAPFFAANVVGDGANGQSIVAITIAVAGIIMAFCAPIIGSMMDRGGYLKPPLFMLVLMLSATSMGLWFVKPGAPGAIMLGVVLMASGYIIYSILEIFHNAMLSMSARPTSLSAVSGIGLAMGNFAGLFVLLLMGHFLAGNNGPLVPVATENYEHLRISGPIVAIWFLVFVIPFFLLMPDIERTPLRSWRKSAQAVFAKNRSEAGRGHLIAKATGYVKELFRLNPNVMRFLVGRMIYADGIGALLTLGSVYVGGFLGWSASQLIFYNVVGGACAVIGALTAGMMDRVLGPKRSLIIELSVLIAVLVFQLSVTRDTILFGLIPSDHIVWEGGIFPTLTDLIYFLMIFPACIMLGACISSSRYMLLHIAPPKQIGQFFGFYAMAGSVTIWVAPLAVGLVTWLTGDQRIGMSGLGLLFIAGLWIICGVKADKTPEHLKETPTL